jgi:hypothetical protein
MKHELSSAAMSFFIVLFEPALMNLTFTDRRHRFLVAAAPEVGARIKRSSLLAN